jgi:hypothetical protein
MPTRKTDPAAEQATASTTPPAPPVAQPVARRMPGLAIAAIAVGSVIVAGVLFGGGVVVGTHLPAVGGQFATGERAHHAFPFGPNGQGGPGPARPGQGGQDQDGKKP